MRYPSLESTASSFVARAAPLTITCLVGNAPKSRLSVLTEVSMVMCRLRARGDSLLWGVLHCDLIHAVGNRLYGTSFVTFCSLLFCLVVVERSNTWKHLSFKEFKGSATTSGNVRHAFGESGLFDSGDRVAATDDSCAPLASEFGQS